MTATSWAFIPTKVTFEWHPVAATEANVVWLAKSFVRNIMAEFDFTPYRILYEEHIVPEEFENLILDDNGASWQAIYISVGLTLFQTILFLTIFEIGRRNKYVESVFDRRRTRYPKRVPAPLLQKEGFARGWLAFEWWRVRLTDEDYTNRSWAENRKRQIETINSQQSQALLTKEINDMFVKEAENHVYMSSPIRKHETQAKQKGAETAPPRPVQPMSYNEDDMEISSFDDSSSEDDHYSSDDSMNDVEKAAAAKYGYGDDIQANNPYGYGDNANPYGYDDDAPQQLSAPQHKDNPYGYGDDAPQQRISSTQDSSSYGYDGVSQQLNPYGYGDDTPQIKPYGYDQEPNNPYGYENIDSENRLTDPKDNSYGNMSIESEESSTSTATPLHPQADDSPYGSMDMQLAEDSTSSYEQETAQRQHSSNEFPPTSATQTPQQSLVSVVIEPSQPETRRVSSQDLLAQIERVEAELQATKMLRRSQLEPPPKKLDSPRLTFFTGAETKIATETPTAPKSANSSKPSFDLDSIIGNVTSGASKPKSSQMSPPFCLDSILGNLGDDSKTRAGDTIESKPSFDVDEFLNSLKSKKTRGLKGSQSFDVDEILGNLKSPPTRKVSSKPKMDVDEILKSPPANKTSSTGFDLDSILGNISTNSKKSAEPGERSDSKPSSATDTTPSFSLDNILGNITSPPLPGSAAPSISKASHDLESVLGNVSSLSVPKHTATTPTFNLDNLLGNFGSSGTRENANSTEKNLDLTACNPSARPPVSTVPDTSDSLDNIAVAKKPDAESSTNVPKPKLVPMKPEDNSVPAQRKRRGRRGSTSFESSSVPSQTSSVSSVSSLGSSQRESALSEPAPKPRVRRGRRGSTSFESSSVPSKTNPSGGHTKTDSPDLTVPTEPTTEFSFEVPYGEPDSNGPLTIEGMDNLGGSQHSSDGNRRRRRLGRNHSFSTTSSSDRFARISATSASVTNYVMTKVLMMNDGKEEEEDDTIEEGNFIATKVTRRKLKPEEKELLRCIGLDAFMTLRFLKFGFDVSFWPMILSIATLLPVYKTASYQADIFGFFSTTIISLAFSEEYWRYWIPVVFAAVHFCYILRRLWIEWEIFLPLRYDFLENGDFEKERYKEQYRKTCIVEFIPREYKQDKSLHEFFDSISPGEVERAEVLLNTEYLRALIKEKMKHILAYEDVYAKKVHLRARYLRALKDHQWAAGSATRKCCRRTMKQPQEPSEITVRAKHSMLQENGKESENEGTGQVPALKYHFENIQRLNREIDDEYMRLAQAQRRKVEHAPLSFLSRWLGLRYVLTGQDTSRLHSSTAFVQFKTFSAKQHAIQCNITGMHNYMVVTPVPEVRDLIWDNMHVSRSLIDTRKAWANLLLAGGLLLWSTIIFSIRSVNNISTLIEPITDSTAVAAFLDVYAPALIVEGLVRLIPNLIKALCILIRFKAHSERDHYVLRWYFGYRLLTFIFLIIGGTTLIESGDSLVRDPIQFIKNLAGNVASNAQFFISYVIVSGGIQVFFRLSQWHNLAIFMLVHKVTKEESLSQRRLEKMEKNIKTFHLDEFIPLFLFIFMVGALYGFIAPLAGVFVAGFFLLARKVFTFMTLFIYGNHFEGGGFLFYTMSDILFYVMYMIILVVIGYFSIRGTGVQAGVFSIMLFVVLVVHRDVRNTFVEPSRTLSLAKARAFDESQDTRTLRERKFEHYKRARKEYDAAVRKEEEEARGVDSSQQLFKRLLPRVQSGELSLDSSHTNDARNSITDKSSLHDAIQRFNERYNGEDAFDDDEDLNNDDAPTNQNTNFFIYRQPSLNRATWEVAPKPYRDSVERDEAAEVWGDERPEQTRKVARQRRASIAMYYGG